MRKDSEICEYCFYCEKPGVASWLPGDVCGAQSCVFDDGHEGRALL